MTDINEVRTALELFAASKDCPAADEQRIRAILDHHARLQAKLGKLQAMQGRMRDPERQMVCDIIANGLDRETAGVGRYEVPDAQPAPAIDLWQFRELLNQWKGSEYPLSYEGTHSQRALNACIADLQALIDGQARPFNGEMRPEDLAAESWPPQTGFQLGLPRGIKLTHKPTGTVVTCDTERSQHANRNKALDMLRAKLQPAKGEGVGNGD